MTRKKKSRKPAGTIIEALEPRILFSADAFSVALDHDNGSDPLADALEQARQEYDALMAESKLANAQQRALELASASDEQDVLPASAEQDAVTHELVFVDTDTPDYQQLVDDLVGNTDSSRQFDVILLDNSSDGIAQITAALSGYSELDAVHIISHGENGAIDLGASQLNQQSLIANSDAISLWSNAFSINGDLLIYGCNLAATSDGELLVNRLAAITGADVAASDDLTGSAALGGDWDLEYRTGKIEYGIAISSSTQFSYSGVLAIYEVTNTNDSGANSLREAISLANATTNVDDIIRFNIAGSGVHKITLLTDLDFIIDTVTIDATYESDYVSNGSTPLIELDGNSISGSTAAFRIVSDNTTIKGFSIYGFGDEGFEIFQDLTYGATSGSNNTIEDNWVGLKADGTTTDGVTGHGILIADLAANNTVRNNVVVSSGDSGIQLGLTGGSGSTDGNKVQGNIIGLKADGISLAGNNVGIAVVGGSTNNIIGTDSDTVNDANEGNVISASTGSGIYLGGSSSTTVTGNYIGTDVGGTLQKGNGTYGIEINNSDTNTIGGSTADQRNVIVDNGNSGISIWNTSTFNNVILGNYIGVDSTGIASLGNYSDGIVIGGGAYNNTIGGDRTAGEGNVISGNIGASVDGIEIYGAGTTGNKVYGNYIGTNFDGTAALGNGRYGVVLYNGAQNTEIGGLGTGEGNIIAGNTNYGVIIDGANLTNTHNNTIAANLIGLAADGTTIIANAGGILINQGAYDNTVGGNSSAARNTISGNNGAAVFITGTGTDGNNVQGNYLGTDFGGTLDKGNTGTNIEIELGASDNTVIGNIIAFAGNDGIVIADSSTSGNIIQGNAIGTNLSGTLDLGNSSDGMVILDGASDNLIGGTSPGDGNLIFHNGATGIKVRTITTDDNSILGNQFFDNTSIGIELGTDGVTSNDAGDSDSGANDGLNYPVITQADRIGTGLTVSGSIDTDGALNTQYRLEFYGNSAGSQDATNGEGRYYLGTTTVIVDGSGDATFSAISLPNVTLLAGDYVTATATRIADTGQVGVNDLLAYSETSEFAVNFAVTDTNDAPLLDDGNLATTYKNNPNPNGQSVIAIFNSGFVDPDAGSSLAGLAVVGNTANAGTEGTWEYSSDGGTNWYAIGSVDDATNALALDAATKLRFVPALDYTGSPTELTVRAIDNSYVGAFTTSAGSEARAPIDTTSNGGTTPIEGNTTLLTTSISDEVPSLWLSTRGDDNSSGFGGLSSVEDSDILAFSDPTLALGDVTTGTASKVFNIDAFTGDEKLNGLHYVQTSLTLGGTSYASIDVNRGDVIFALEGGATLTSGASSVSVGAKDVVLFSPDTEGDYSSGTFTVLLNDPTGDDIRGITLVESNTVVGDTTVNAGDFLLVTSGGGDRSAQLFQVDDVGDGINTVGTSSILISGNDTNIAVSKNWYGIHLISNNTTIGGTTLTEGQILIAVDGPAVVGTNNLSVDEFDIFVLNITKTTIGSGVGNGEASASMFFDGSDVLLDSGSEKINAIALAHINTAPTDIASSTSAINENIDTTGGYNLGALTSTDQDIGDTAAYSIVGGADAAKFTLGGVGADELILDDGMLDFESKPSYSVTIRVTDSVGNTYDETLTITVNNLNDAPVAVDDHTSLDFDGVDDYVLIADSASLTMTNTMTMEAWIQPDTSANAYQMIMNKEGEYEVALFADGSLAWAFGGSDPAWGWINTGYIAADNEWIHIAVSYDNGVVNSYVNGSLVHTYNGSGPIGDANGPMDTFRIGGRENAPAGQYFDGKIDEVRVWNTARTQLEIQANLDANLAGNETGLAGYWKLNEGSGTTASDLTANANHGTLTDGAATGTPLWSAYVTDQDTPHVVLAADGVLANDVDADGDTLTVTKVNGAAIVGEITLLSTAKITMGSAGDFTYDPNGAFDYLDLGESAVDSFIYEISDGNGGTDTAFAYITITGINDTPTAGTIADFSVPEDTATSTIDLKAIFEDDEDTDTELTYSIQSNSNAGLFDSVTINASKIFTLAYAADQNGFADFTLRATDTSGEFVEVSFRVTVDPVNDAPVLSVETGDSVAETLTETNATLSVSDTVTVTDIEMTDLVSSSVLSVVESGDTSGIANATLLAMMGISGDLDATETSEALVWAFNSGAENFNYLQAGETLTLTYTVQVDDGTAQDTQTIVITINGSNDAPTLSVETGDSVAETLSETNATLSVSDTVTVTDVDLTDLVSSSVLSVAESGNTSGIANATLLAMMGIAGDLDATETSEALVWAFNSGVETFDYLQAGETLTLTYTVQVDDGTAQDTQTIVITINGSNDAPVLSVETGDSVAETLTETNTTLSVSDTVTVTDVDLTDLVSSSVLSVVESGATSGIANGTLLAMMGITGDLDATETSEALVWAFNSGAENFNYLQAGETLTLTYTVQVDDGTAQDTQTIVITINGSNDAPVLSVETGDSVAETLTETNTTLSVSDTVTVTDVDLTDLVSSSVLSVVESGATSGIANGTLLAMMGITGDLDATETSEALVWAFNSGAENFNYLQAGETLTLTYTVQVDDGTAQDTQTIVITINGSNDAPVLSVETGDSVAETLTETNSTLSISDTVTVTDVDLTDLVSSSVISVVESGDTSGIANATLLAMMGISGDLDATETSEALVWAFNSGAESFDYLEAGQTLTLTYTVQVDDGTAQDTQTIVITINGSNDAPVLSVETGDSVAETLTETNATLSVSDTVTVTDVDLTDVVSSSVLSVVESGNTSGIANATLLAMMGITGDLDATETSEALVWAFNSGAESFDYLEAGQTLTLTYNVQVDDGAAQDTQTIVITINGSNDAPVLSVETGDSVAETLTETNTTLSISDTVTVTDVDLTDLVSSSVLSVVESGDTSGIANATLLAMMGISGDLDVTETSEALVWAFNSGAESFDYLQAGETLTLTYTVQVDDGTAQDTQTIVITINGSNDAPVLSVETGDSVAETLTETNTTLSVSDTVTVTDVDLTDLVSSSVLSVTESGDISGIANATLLAMMGISGDLDATETSEALIWAFNSGSETFDYLEAGQTLTLTYTVEVDDGTAQDTQTIVITINGSNDAPVLSVETGDSVAETLTETNTTLSVSDTVTVTDVDLTDLVSSSVLSVTESGDTSGIANATLLAMMGITGDLDATETSEALVWAFNSGAESFDYLQAGETLTLTYTVQVDDGTAQDTQTIVITINGSNDAPVLSVETGDSVAETLTETNTTLSISDTVTVTDVDLTDLVSSSVLSVVESGNTSGIANGTLLAMMGITGDLDATETSEALVWAFNSGAESFDYLEAGQTLTLTYTVEVDDGTAQDTQTIVITINGSNDAPVLSVETGDSVAETLTESNTTLSVGDTVTVTDVDLTDLVSSSVLSVVESGNTSGIANATLLAMMGITGDLDATETNEALVWAFNSGAENFDYLEAGQTLTLTYTVQVDDGTAQDTQTIVITINGSNDAPVITGGPDTSALTETNAGLTDSGTLTVTDVDTTDTVTAAVDTVTVGGTGAAGVPGTLTNTILKGFLSVAPTTILNGTQTTNTLTWTFNSSSEAFDFLADGETLILTYTVSATDDSGTPLNDTETVTVTITGTNDAPVLDNTGATTLPTITKLQTNNGGASVATIISNAGGIVTDADTGSVEGIAITTLASGNGSWEYSINGGASWSVIGTVANNSALLLGANDMVRFVPNGVSGTTASFDFHAWDQTSGTAGAKVDPTSGSTAFSTLIETANITVTNVNAAPVLDNSASPVLSPVDEDAGAPGLGDGSLISELVDFASPAGQLDNVTDIDSGAGLGVAINAADTINGAWFYSIDNGANWNALGAVSDANARLLADDGLTRLYFQANADYHGTLANAITFHAWDQTSGSNGGTASIISGPHTVLDNFNNNSYTNNNGTQSWSTGWIETDTGGAGTFFGEIVVKTNALEVKAKTLNDEIYREVDLASASTATLTFSYNNPLSGSDSIAVQVSGNGGTSYSTLYTFDNSTNTGSGSKSVDISAYIASDTRIRIVVMAVDAVPSKLTFDDIQIQYDGRGGGTSAFSIAEDTASLTVNPVADTPSVTAATTNEDTQSTSGLVISRNVVDGAEVTHYKITGITDGTLYKNDGTTQITNGSFITFAEGNAGLKFTPDADFNGTGNFTVQASTANNDSGLGGSTTVASVTVDPINDAPVLSVETGDSVAETLTESNTTLSVSDTVTVTDVDLTDLVSSSVLSVVESGDTSGIANATLLAMMGITGDLDATETSEALVWAFNSGAESFDYLQAGETLTLTYTIQVDDGTAQDTQTIVITINGSNDAPVLSVETGDSVAETLTETNTTLSISDTVTVTDLDLTDVVSSSVLSVVESGDTSGIANATLLAMMGITGDLDATETSEALVWAFNSGSESFDYLQAGETLTLTYTVEVDDGTAQDTQTIVITINGSNDAPVLSVETGDSVAETLTETNTTLSVSDTVTVTDIDLTDVVSSSVLSVVETGDTSGIANATLLAMMGISGDLNATETSEALVWAFNSGTESFDYLQAGETLTLTYTVQVDDGTAQDTQTIVITINGSNDAPVLSVETGDSVAETLTETNTTLSVSDTVTVTDLDLTDVVSSSVLSVVESGDTSGIANGTLLAMMGISGDLDAIETSEALVWAFNSGAEGFNYLQAGETLTLTYTVQVDDGTAQDTQTIVITINGSNDAPILSVETGDSVAETLTESNTTLSVSDTVTVTDVDLTDLVSSSVLSVVESGDTSGIANATLLAMMGITGDLDATETSEALVWAFNSGAENFDYLIAGQTLTLTYTVQVNDGAAQDTQTIVITINGSNDAPVIGGVDTGAVTEDVDPDSDALLEVNNALTIADPDASESNFVAETIVGTYGNLVIDAAGNWSYSADNTQVAIQQLDVTEFVTDTFTVTTADGSTHDIVITINGAEDAPTVDNAIPDQSTAEDSVYNYTFNANVFGDADASDTLTYAAQLSGGAALPSWLTFNDATRSFVGVPLNADVGFIDIEVIADDGSSTVSDVFRLTITNTDDAPVITGDDTGAVTEDVDPDSDTLLEDTGTLNVVDPDAGESSFVAETIIGTYGDLVIDSAGSWSYSADNTQVAIQQLDTTESITDTLTVTTADGTTHNIVITINGSNDAPVLTVETGDSVAETLTETNTTLSVSNTVTVTDVDLTDLVSSSVLSVTESGDTSGIANATLLAMMGISGDLDATETSEALVWAFNSGAESFDYLQAGETLTLTYTVEVDDSTTQDTQTIVITINGSNDAPILSVETGDSVAETLTESNTTLSVSDTVTVTDVDLTDLVSSSVLSVVESGDTSGIANATLLAMMGISGDLDATETSEALVWAFNSGAESFDYLQAGETLTLTYTVEVDDGTAQDTQTIVITINGSNDAPVLSVETGDSVAETLTETNTTLSVSDTVTVTDVDLTDVVTSNVLSVVETGDTSGIANATLLAMMGISGDLDATETSEALAWAFNSGAETFNYLEAGQTLTLTYTVQVDDGTAQDTQTIVITINGSSDAPVIGGVNTGTVTEDVDPDTDGLLEVNNALTIADPDAGQSSFIAETIVGTYGDLVIDAVGNWSYSADNAQAAIQQLDVSEFITDTLTVTTADGTTHNIVITINGAEDAPVLGGTNTGTVAEDGTLIASNTLTITDTDSNDNPISYNDQTSIAGSNGYGNFVMSGNTWTYTLNNSHAAVQALDVTESLTDTFTFTATDGSSMQTVTVTIDGAEDAPTVDNAIPNQNATEDTAYSFTFNANSFGDVDTSDTLTYTAQLNGGGTLPTWLSFDVNTRTFSGTPLNADVGIISIDVIANDGSSTVTDTFTLTVANTDDAPVIGGVDTGAVTEDVDPDTDGLLEVNNALTIADPDVGESSFVAETVAGTYGDLVIDATGNWSYSADNTQAAIQQLDVTEFITDTLTVTTADGTTHDIVITINGAEDAPVLGGVNTGTVAEDGTLVASATLTITDTDTNDNPISYTDQTSIAGSNGYGNFVMSGNTWTYTLNNSHADVQALDVTESLTDTFTFTATDGSSTQTVTVTINGAEDASVAGGTNTGSVAEDGTLVASNTLTITDVDSNDNPVSYNDQTSIAGDNGYGNFAMSGNNWTYTLANGSTAVQSLDAGQTVNDSFTFTASDGTTRQVTVTISGNEDAPTASDNTIRIDQNTSHTLSAGDFGFSDIDGDAMNSVRITALETAGDLKLAGSDVNLNDSISRADIDAGLLTWAPLGIGSGDNYASFGFSVNDGAVDSGNYSITYDVTTLFTPDPDPTPEPEPEPEPEEPAPEENTPEPEVIANEPELPLAQEEEVTQETGLIHLIDDTADDSLNLPSPLAAEAVEGLVNGDQDSEHDSIPIKQFDLANLDISEFTIENLLLLQQPNFMDNDRFVDALDNLSYELDQVASRESAEYSLGAETRLGIAVSLSAGFVSWALRAGSLLASMFSVMPLWKQLDPLPIVGTKSEKEEELEARAERDESAENEADDPNDPDERAKKQDAKLERLFRN